MANITSDSGVSFRQSLQDGQIDEMSRKLGLGASEAYDKMLMNKMLTGKDIGKPNDFISNAMGRTSGILGDTHLRPKGPFVVPSHASFEPSDNSIMDILIMRDDLEELLDGSHVMFKFLAKSTVREMIRELRRDISLHKTTYRINESQILTYMARKANLERASHEFNAVSEAEVPF